jgi:hypothetical protein
MKPIEKGSIVKYKNGWMRVTAKFKTHVNLGGIFAGKTSVKGVPFGEVKEDEDTWYEHWQESESYKCM